MRLLYTKRGRRAWGTGLGSRAGRDRHPCERTCHSRGGGAEQAGVPQEKAPVGAAWLQGLGMRGCDLSPDSIMCVLPAPHVLPGPLPAAAGGPPADVGWGVRTVSLAFGRCWPGRCPGAPWHSFRSVLAASPLPSSPGARDRPALVQSHRLPVCRPGGLNSIRQAPRTVSVLLTPCG